jgi:hypothetical protein
VVQAEIPALPFVKKYANVFSFNSTFMASLEATSQKCGYTNYIEKYVTYPPKGPLPLPGGTTDISDECDIWTAIIEAALEINPAFNLYRIFDVVGWSSLARFASILTALASVPSIVGCAWLSVSSCTFFSLTILMEYIEVLSLLSNHPFTLTEWMSSALFMRL